MFKVGFVSVKGGTGKTVLAASAVLYLNAAVTAAGLVDASPVPVAAWLIGAETKPGVYVARDVPVAVVGDPEAVEKGYEALRRYDAAIAVVDFPPLFKTPRLDVAVVVADPPSLEFTQLKPDARSIILALNMADELRRDLANAHVVLPYSPVVAKAYLTGIPPILIRHPKAATLISWKKAFLRLMDLIVREA